MPEEVCEDDELVGYNPNAIHENPGAVVLIEGALHGDDQDGQDYAKCVILTTTLRCLTYPPFGTARC